MLLRTGRAWKAWEWGISLNESCVHSSALGGASTAAQCSMRSARVLMHACAAQAAEAARKATCLLLLLVLFGPDDNPHLQGRRQGRVVHTRRIGSRYAISRVSSVLISMRYMPATSGSSTLAASGGGGAVACPAQVATARPGQLTFFFSSCSWCLMTTFICRVGGDRTIAVSKCAPRLAAVAHDSGGSRSTSIQPAAVQRLAHQVAAPVARHETLAAMAAAADRLQRQDSWHSHSLLPAGPSWRARACAQPAPASGSVRLGVSYSGAPGLGGRRRRACSACALAQVAVAVPGSAPLSFGMRAAAKQQYQLR